MWQQQNELFEFARSGDIRGVMTLVWQRLARVNTPNRWNQSALLLAFENGHRAVTFFLLRNGAYERTKPVIAAARYGHYDCVKLLLQYQADANCSSMGETPMSVALQGHHYSAILLLLQYGAKAPVLLDDMAVQLLQHAKARDAEVIEKLIDENFINLTSQSTFLAAFDFAFKHGSVKLAESRPMLCHLINDSYSQIEQLYNKAVYYSAKNNWPDILSRFIEKVDVNALTEGQTPLYAACKKEINLW